MGEWKDLTEESRQRWQRNADFWDSYMGNESNAFHRELIRPNTEQFLEVREGQRILDIACGNGNFSRRLAELGARVVAFDYSSALIECARERAAGLAIDFRVLDGTDYQALVALGPESFDGAVTNMALMDMAEIKPLLGAVYALLKPGGRFVFSVCHPCFHAPGAENGYGPVGGEGEQSWVKIHKYLASESHEGDSIRNQPVPTVYFHRSLTTLCSLCFEAGFVLDGLAEPAFSCLPRPQRFEWCDIPPVLICRLRKQ